MDGLFEKIAEETRRKLAQTYLWSGSFIILGSSIGYMIGYYIGARNCTK